MSIEWHLYLYLKTGKIYYFQLGICVTFFPILKYLLVDIHLGDLSVIRTLARFSHEKTSSQRSSPRKYKLDELFH